MPSGRLAAVVPTWNRREPLLGVLASLRAQTLPPDEILVVDNGSTDRAAEAAEGAGASVLRMGRNAGFAAAVNRGLRECRAEWVAVVNNDVALAPDYLALLRSALEESGRWFATGKLLAGSRDGRLDGAFDVLCRGGCALRVGHGMEDGREFSERRVIYAAPWTAALFRAALFEKTGLLDERFVSYLEDVDFGVRCAALRLAGEYVPEALAWHEGSATLGRWSAETVRSMARNQTLLAARWLAGRDFWNVAVAQALWGLAAVRHRRALAWTQGKWQGLRCWNDLRSTYDPHSREALRGWLHENERRVRGDASWFWRVYSLLTPGEAM